nr:radial spoke head 10 homolog B-like [Nomia melanderi]
MMEGKGVYKWSNGAQYKGEFERNRMHGWGLLEWNSNRWYEGDFANGYQHGKGLLVDSDKHFMYTGQWFEGHKHGSGYCRYEDKGSYDGDWVMDKMCGFGLRIYASGARYAGQWKNGVRHGIGTMVWANGDVYRGEWRNGEMNGYGIYVWNAFFNKTFTWPQETTYIGYWRNGLRSGEGTLKLSTVGGAKYSGYWKSNKKHGHGTIIGNNGEKMEADPLFLDDILVSSDNADGISQEQLATTSNQCVRTPKEDKPVFVEKPSKLRIAPITPVLKPEQFPSLSYYLTRLLDPKSLEGPLIRSVPSGKCYSCENQSCSCLTRSSNDIIKSEEKIDRKLEKDSALASEREYEERWVYNCLTMHMSRLRQIYANAAKIFAPSTMECKLVMSRMCLWQLWRDCKITKKGLSLIEIDNYIAMNKFTIVNDPHDPFEKIEIWQFLHALIEVSWHLYTKQNNIHTQDMNGKLAGGLHIFLENDVYPHVGNHVGSLCREYLNLLPMKAVFKMCQNIGYPCAVKDLLRAVYCPEGTQYSKSSSTGDEMGKHRPVGINAVTIGENMRYLTEGNDIFSSPHHECNTSKHHADDGLFIFKQLRATKTLEIISLICVGVKDSDSGIIINIDYEV